MIQILLVEDDPGIGTGLKMNLEFEGYALSWVQDLRTARRLESEIKFDLLILDLNLPDGSGLSFCAEIRGRGSKVPIIILTAKADEDTVVEGLKIGANDYVRKPFGQRELIARIQNTPSRG